ncbi:MAG: PEP-CTERM sorting domain-containing protein [Cyanobacteriota bacterium]|nr:PEP-CTERM sorting domain-containing protein [Cyanobacteriota bacterium]
MIANLLQKVLVSSTVFTVIGFSTILGAMNSASALTVESESENKKGVIQNISHINFFLEDNSGKVTKVKIDSVSGTTSFDATNFLNTYYSDYEVLAYEVKAAKFKSFQDVVKSDSYDSAKQLDGLAEVEKQQANTTFTYNEGSVPTYKEGVAPPEPESTTDNEDQVEDTTSNNGEPAPDTEVPENTYTEPQEPSEKKVKVPEPGSLAAIAIFGLGGLLRKKKASS